MRVSCASQALVMAFRPRVSTVLEDGLNSDGSICAFGWFDLVDSDVVVVVADVVASMFTIVVADVVAFVVARVVADVVAEVVADVFADVVAVVVAFVVAFVVAVVVADVGAYVVAVVVAEKVSIKRCLDKFAVLVKFKGCDFQDVF